MGNPQLAEAFHRLAHRWCLAAEHIVKIEKREPVRGVDSPWGVSSLSALSGSLLKTRRHKRTALVSPFALRPQPLLAFSFHQKATDDPRIERDFEARGRTEWTRQVCSDRHALLTEEGLSKVSADAW